METLGIGSVPAATRIALRRRFQTQVTTWMVTIPIWLVEARILFAITGEWFASDAPVWLREDLRVNDPSALSRAAWTQLGRDFAQVVPFLLLARRTSSAVATLFGAYGYRYSRVDIWAGLINECAKIYQTRGAVHGRLELENLRYSVLAVRGAASMRGTVPFFAWRRRYLARRHAADVAATFRAVAAMMDANPREGAVKLARLALRTSERYAEGRVSALLDEEEMVPRRSGAEAVRLVFAALMIAAMATLGAAFSVPSQIVAVAAVLAIAVLYRHSIPRGLEILTLLAALLLVAR